MLECLSYIFYHTSSIVGPSFEFSDFRKFINYSDEYSNINMKDAILAGTPDLIKAVLLIYPLLSLSKPFNIDHHAEPEFKSYSILYQVSFQP